MTQEHRELRRICTDFNCLLGKTGQAYTLPSLLLLVRFQGSLSVKMREIVHIQAGQCGNQIGSCTRLLYAPPWERLKVQSVLALARFAVNKLAV